MEDTEYTFAQGLEPIKAKETEVTFEKGVLKIKPHNASFYQHDAGNSELDINFNNSPFILTAHIRTKAQASKGIIPLLKHYSIPFPFEQKVGLTDTDLTLAINLSTIDVDAKGTFRADNSVFEYDQQLFRITGELDAAKSRGDLQASIDKFTYQSAHSTLLLVNPDSARLIVNYHMSPDGDSISAGESYWKTG